MLLLPQTYSGWECIFNLTEVQTSPNTGEVVIICAQRRNLNYSGHICATVSEIETDNHNAEWSHGEVVKPNRIRREVRIFVMPH